MLLAIDIGNSTISVGLFGEGARLVFISSLNTDKNATCDQCAIAIMNLFRLYKCDLAAVTGAIVCSVVPPVTSSVAAAIETLFGKPPMVVGPGIKTGLNIKTEIHAQLGSDIVASAVSALNKYKTPIVVIDMGTATTFSLISERNTFEGCIIFPGVRIALEALSEHAAQLPFISIDTPDSLIGKNTIDSMRSGILYGNAGMIDNVIGRIEETAGSVSTVVATGGNAPLILPQCRRSIIYNKDLLMEGLYLIYYRNAECCR
ncbi:type III pantothenate kinase [Papillibacter cinnamivorans]|uniref:Type III pantothenate kinase n=1 Tax=Papillibacter cinnamivorans DSM 12816 TaxID=1122930 RepID=A0A1W1ZPR2_9FIRM|nr:type III pantothenate kinase [Papillibacter cinnamivorans]SMC50202.1 type III pantothenate kinase [Papillibacter cinnamivorans DSM 12816]